MRRCLEQDVDMVLICIYLVHVAMKVLFKDTMCQFYKSFLECSFYHRVSVFRYYNQVVFKVIATMPISAITQRFSSFHVALQPNISVL